MPAASATSEFEAGRQKKRRAPPRQLDREERFRALIENSADTIVLLDACGAIQWASPSIEREVDYSVKDEFLGHGAFEFIHPEDQPVLMASLKQLLSEPGGTVTGRFRARRRDGSWRWIDATAKNLLDDPRLQAIVCNYRDITERKMVEDALEESEGAVRRSEEQFRTLIENASDIIVVLQPDGSIRYLSPSVERVLGFSPAELASPTLFSLVHPDDVSAVTMAILKAVQNIGQPQSAQFRVRHQNGEWRHLEGVGRALIDDSGAPFGIINCRDVTDRVRAEEELRRQTEALKEQARILDLAHVLICDVDHTIIFWNRGAEEFYGWARGEAIGRVSHELLRTQFPEPLKQIDSALLRDWHWEGELIQTRRDGKEVVVSSHWVLHRDVHGHPVSILKIHNDITQLRRAEEQLKRSQDYLRSLLSKASDLAAFLEPGSPAGGEDTAIEKRVLASLTRRELQVLQLLSGGRTNKEIALEMRYSVGTVKNVVQRIIEKLGVSDRTQAAVYAVRAGMDIDLSD